jgi:hypothetical protein
LYRRRAFNGAAAQRKVEELAFANSLISKENHWTFHEQPAFSLRFHRYILLAG